MSPLAERVAAAINQHSPQVLCFACLSTQYHVKEHDVRAVALILIVRSDLRLVRRVCSSCRRMNEALVPRKAA